MIPPRVAVIGSGPSGVAAASVLRHRGIAVTLLDGGRRPGPDSAALAEGLRTRLDAGLRPTGPQMRALRDPVKTGGTLRDFGRLLTGRPMDPRGIRKRVLGSDHAFAGADEVLPLEGHWLARTLAVGGLSTAWGAACYPLRPDETAAWPLPPGALDPWYGEAARLLGRRWSVDDLATVYPMPEGTAREAELPLPEAMQDPVFSALTAHWDAHRATLRAEGLRGGAARLAVMPPRPSGEDGAATACRRCGLCLFGCPWGAIWSADHALSALAAGLDHRTGWRVTRLEETADGTAEAVWLACVRPDGTAARLGPFDAVVLAAGALGSLRLVADSLPADRKPITAGLVENDMLVMPFALSPAVRDDTGRPPAFALAQGVLALDPTPDSPYPAHLQLYRPTERLLGPLGRLLGSLPPALAGVAARQARRIVIGSLYLHGAASRALSVTVTPDRMTVQGDRTNTGIAAEADALDRLTRAAHGTGLTPLRRLAQRLPPGFSCHLGGTLPMTATPPDDRRPSCTPQGRIRGLRRVYIADMASFPTMSAQNPTFTAMANAMRIARSMADTLPCSGTGDKGSAHPGEP